MRLSNRAIVNAEQHSLSTEAQNVTMTPFIVSGTVVLAGTIIVWVIFARARRRKDRASG
jgi:hypothetical protein